MEEILFPEANLGLPFGVIGLIMLLVLLAGAVMVHVHLPSSRHWPEEFHPRLARKFARAGVPHSYVISIYRGDALAAAMGSGAVAEDIIVAHQGGIPAEWAREALFSEWASRSSQ